MAIFAEQLLTSPFIDDRLLFRGYGLRRGDVEEFHSVYKALPVEDRPLLSPYFDPRWYSENNSEVVQAGWDPFSHFIQIGFSQGRSPHPLVNLSYIKKQTGETTAGHHGLNRLMEILTSGACDPTPYFDQRFYLESNPNACEFPSGPLGHFLESPADSCSIPCQFFDADFYRARYSDAPHSRRGAFLHFCAYGDRQRRFPAAEFDPDWYFHRNLDRADVPPLYHFLEYGRYEGRTTRDSRRMSVGVAVALGSTSSPSMTAEEGRERYEAVRTALAMTRQQRIQAVEEYEARPVQIPTMEQFEDFAVPQGLDPKVSIIIPMYNEVRITLECLKSIEQSKTNVSIEVIVVDDCSSDPDLPVLRSLPGLIYVRQERNLNFLRSCNSVLPRCRGEYVFLLNNDAQLCDRAIDALSRVLDEDSGIGVVGPKFLFPNGRLQEAGCTVNFDATSEMVGVFGDANDRSYSYPRDVDYVSGAALMVRRSLLGNTIFDDELAPAYCEDLELCVRVAAKGYRIRYVADAVVVHHLSVTMSDHSKKMQQIVKNQHALFTKWTEQLAEMNRVRVISFYLPQFHPTPENDLWWGKGFTEWTNVSKATPSYQGHYQPHLPTDLGFYDLRVPKIYKEQADLLRRYGLEGVCLYYYNFSGQTFLSEPLNVILNNPDIPLNFCLCWANENWSRRWDGGNQDLLMEQLYDSNTLTGILDDLFIAVSDPRYIKVNGRPIFLIYRPLIIPDVRKLVAKLRKEALVLLGTDLHMVFVESMESLEVKADPIDYGFDAAVEFPPHGLGVPAADKREVFKPGWAGHRYDYEMTIQQAILRPGVTWPRYPTVFPSWDNTARQPLQGTSFDNCSPELFKLYVEEKVLECRRMFTGDERLVFVNAWNEWAEGAHLEPDSGYGHRWLEAIRQALQDASWAV